MKNIDAVAIEALGKVIAATLGPNRGFLIMAWEFTDGPEAADVFTASNITPAQTCDIMRDFIKANE